MCTRLRRAPWVWARVWEGVAAGICGEWMFCSGWAHACTRRVAESMQSVCLYVSEPADGMDKKKAYNHRLTSREEEG